MKSLSSIFACLLISFSALATEESICFAPKESIPYSGKVFYSSECDGKTFMASSGLFGNQSVALDRFKREIKLQGYSSIKTFFDDNMVIFSKRNLMSTRTCLAMRSKGFIIDCSGDYQVTIKEKTEAGLLKFAQDNGLTLLQKLNADLFLFIE